MAKVRNEKREEKEQNGERVYLTFPLRQGVERAHRQCFYGKENKIKIDCTVKCPVLTQY